MSGQAGLTDYLARVSLALAREDVVGPTTCPECEVEPEVVEGGDHVLAYSPVLGRWVVVVGCEGYWTVDPNLLGIPMPNWSDGTGGFDEGEGPVAP